MTQNVLICLYCQHCDYHLNVAVPRDAIGSHGCAQCDRQMEVFVPHELMYRQ